ncbi:PREDICTED: uncharacterized protein LOC109314224 [Crocodylus porosus]|uniref:uncharacterized protein LOC109314224 n=1 Tax=Crocodylus porosus TaxID=8502 RepID=UPI00093C669F|nr:PREDICTED: uncharacterized protein LOC109314224 [Crocodylus porosus]XP_019396799.1 PREDICTED: uncharacterized protein LOC109314224 [Crocodylus porosus]XP_019396800.1 PREDICTED: uncharacterized protein LOC109314224 [Crocodylus porosus]
MPADLREQGGDVRARLDYKIHRWKPGCASLACPWAPFKFETPPPPPQLLRQENISTLKPEFSGLCSRRAVQPLPRTAEPKSPFPSLPEQRSHLGAAMPYVTKLSARPRRPALPAPSEPAPRVRLLPRAGGEGARRIPPPLLGPGRPALTGQLGGRSLQVSTYFAQSRSETETKNNNNNNNNKNSARLALHRGAPHPGARGAPAAPARRTVPPGRCSPRCASLLASAHGAGWTAGLASVPREEGERARKGGSRPAQPGSSAARILRDPRGDSGSGRTKRKNLLLGSFLALALDLILSACGFFSSLLEPRSSYTLSSSPKHCQFGHLRTCAQSIQSDTLTRAKKSFQCIHHHQVFFFVLSSSSDHLSLPPPSQHHQSLSLICPFKKSQPALLLTLRTLTLHTGQYLRIKVPS